jgi:hypothetical protein
MFGARVLMRANVVVHLVCMRMHDYMGVHLVRQDVVWNANARFNLAQQTAVDPVRAHGETQELHEGAFFSRGDRSACTMRSANKITSSRRA